VRWRRIVAALVLGAVLAPVWSTAAAGPANAHARTLAVTPSDGQELDRAPRTIRVTFDEPVTLAGGPDVGTVLDADGHRVDDGAATLGSGGRVLTIRVDRGLAAGVYIASWSVVSADTHPVGGSAQFGVGVPATAAPVADTPQPSSVLGLVVGITKGALYLALVLAFGVPPALRLLGGTASRSGLGGRVVVIGLVLAAVASVAQVAVQYLWDASARTGAAVSLAGVVEFVRTSAYARPIVLRMAVLVLAAVLVALPSGRRATARDIGLVVAGAVTVGTVVANGHGGGGAWWQFVTTSAHAAAAVAWLGGLVVLGWLVLRSRLGAAETRRLPVWSTYATVCVAVIAVSGLVQTVVEVRFPAALVDTQYGVVLLVKLVLVAVTLVLAAGGARWVRRSRRARDERPAPGATARLRRRVRWETGAAATVVVLSGVLSSVTPAAAAWAPLGVEHVRAGPYAVRVEVEPARRGPESFRVTATQAAFGDPVPESVEVRLSAADGTVRELRVTFPYLVAGTVEPGHPTPVTFISSDVDVPSTGEWEATVTVIESDVVQYTGAVRFTVS
jgi:copper transport protein